MLTLSIVGKAASIKCEEKAINQRLKPHLQPEIRVTKSCEMPDSTRITQQNVVFTNQKNYDVKKLYIVDAKAVQYLPEDISTPYPNLVSIEVMRCGLKSVSNSNFRLLGKLIWLDLSKNSLITLSDEQTFDDLVKLEYLNLGSNKITSVHSKIFSRMIQLRYLHLENNQLTLLDSKMFANNKNMFFLRISGNKLHSLEPGTFDSLTNLAELWLYENKITNLPNNIFDKCRSLTTLLLSDNKIQSINTALLTKLTFLGKFSLAGNPLKVVDFAIFDQNKNIEEIFFERIGDIEIRNVDRISIMRKLTRVNLSKNNCIDGDYGESDNHLLSDLKTDVEAYCT